jgi:hypothetical protein
MFVGNIGFVLTAVIGGVLVTPLNFDRRRAGVHSCGRQFSCRLGS